MISTVDRQDTDLIFNSRGLNYALEITLSSFLWDTVERRKWSLISEKLLQLHGRADIDQEQGPCITIVCSDEKIWFLKPPSRKGFFKIGLFLQLALKQVIFCSNIQPNLVTANAASVQTNTWSWEEVQLWWYYLLDAEFSKYPSEQFRKL